VEIEGKKLLVVECPDPVVEKLRRYAEAIRSIQSAEAEILLADMEEMVAEQQLVVDIMAGFPLVGEALDVYSIYAGENLAGVAIGPTERAFTAVMLLVPILGPKAVDVLKAAFKRSDEALDGARKLEAALDASLNHRAWGNDAYPGMAADLAREAGERAGGAVDELDELLAVVSKALADGPPPPDGSETFILQKLRQAMLDKKAIEAMPAEVRERAYREAIQVFQEGLGALQSATRASRVRASGMVASHADAFADVARKRDEIFMVRDVNPDATRLIEGNAATKPMTIKSKSATEGVIAGAIPVEPALNKTGTQLRRARAELAEAAPGSPTRAYWEGEVAMLEKKVDEAWSVIEHCRETRCAQEVPFTRADGKVVHQTRRPGSDSPSYVVRDDAGRWVDAETGEALDFSPASAPTEVRVLGDPESGRVLTADYDLLNFGKKGEHSAPSYSNDTGFISPEQQEALQELNEAIRGRGYEGGNVVHHGAEENFFKSPGIEGEAITAFEPNGNIISIPKCDVECMKVWCMGRGPSGGRRCDPSKICAMGQKTGCIPVDGDRLFKDYFHLKRIEGWNLDPNPRWGWGDYNPLGGWIESLQCHGCAEAL
jgi:hypothetical protein